MERQIIEVNKQIVKESNINQETKDKMAKLFFLSYRFSQGVPDLQKRIFVYLAYMHPKWTMSEAVLEEIRGISAPRIKSFLEAPKEVAVHETEELEKIDNNINEDLKNMADVFNMNYEELESRKDFLDKLAGFIIARDYNFLVTLEGRPRGNNLLKKR